MRKEDPTLSSDFCRQTIPTESPQSVCNLCEVVPATTSSSSLTATLQEGISVCVCVPQCVASSTTIYSIGASQKSYLQGSEKGLHSPPDHNIHRHTSNKDHLLTEPHSTSCSALPYAHKSTRTHVIH